MLVVGCEQSVCFVGRILETPQADVIAPPFSEYRRKFQWNDAVENGMSLDISCSCKLIVWIDTMIRRLLSVDDAWAAFQA